MAGLTNTAVNTASDLFLALFPTILFWNLHLKTRIKISLIILMSLGVLYVSISPCKIQKEPNHERAMVASIIKTTQIDKVPSIVNTGATGGIGLIRWGYTENVIIIITSSVPVIRPLFISSVKKVSSATRSWTHEITAAGRRSKNNSSSKSTSANTWSKGASSATRQGTPAQIDVDDEAGYGPKVYELTGMGGIPAHAMTGATGVEDDTSAYEESEVGVARGWPEEYSPRTMDYGHGHSHSHSHSRGYSHGQGYSHGYGQEYNQGYGHEYSHSLRNGYGYHSSSGSGSGTASVAASRPESQQSGGITKHVGFSVSSEGGFDSH